MIALILLEKIVFQNLQDLLDQCTKVSLFRMIQNSFEQEADFSLHQGVLSIGGVMFLDLQVHLITLLSMRRSLIRRK